MSQQDLEWLREMAARLDCFIEEDFQMLAGVTAATCTAWKKRGTGPAYILLGNRYLYPRQAVADHLLSLTRTRKALGAEAIL